MSQVCTLAMLKFMVVATKINQWPNSDGGGRDDELINSSQSLNKSTSVAKSVRSLHFIPEILVLYQEADKLDSVFLL